jgi:putative transposase
VRTLTRWFAERDKGLSLLVPRARERGPRVPPWAHALLKAWQQPQKPTLTWALAQLVEPGALPDGVEPPSKSAARRFLAKLHAVDRQRGRMGPRELKNIRPYRLRDASGLWPGEVYTMDGHTFDAEVAHPFHGQPFRPEITACLDVATRRLVGWSVALAESALAVLDALRHAVQVGGIPAILYVDNGTGYANALMEDQAVGFMARLGITKQHSLPYNSQARGAIERAHRTIWVKLAKTLPTYMGMGMDQEARNRAYKLTRQEIAATGSSRLLPAWAEFVAACERAAADYNARPHAANPKISDPLTGKKRHLSPDELWADLIRQNPECLAPVAEADLADLFRPYKTAKIVRGWVRLFGNRYFHDDLAGHHAESAFVGYDIHDAGRVWVRDRNQRLIAVALLNGNSAPYFGTSAVEVAAIGRAKARAHRLERRLDEVHLELAGGRPALEGRVATPEEAAAAREYLAARAAEPPAPAAPAMAPESSSEPAPVAGRPRVFESDLDLWRWVNDRPDDATDRDRAYLADCLEDDDFRHLVECEAQKKSRAKAA